MIGAEPPPEALPPRRRLDETPVQFERRLLREGLNQLDEGLRAERNRFPFTRAGRAALKSLIDVLKTGRMETRRYERAFMHAKAYIFAPRTETYGGGAGVIAGSSNLTRAGVTHNLELNLGRFDDPVVGQAQAWYERLWEEAVPVDLTELLEEVFAEWTPFDIFLRTLYQLYGSEVEELAKIDQGLPLTSFQKHGAARALRLINETGGAIVADEVGLGKTFIAGEILKLYIDRRHRCLLVCPAQLRDSTWKKFRSTHFLSDVECVSYEELAIDRQLAMGNPDQFQDKLQRPLREYQLVVVDEAHNYRNPDASTRAAVLRKLLWGQRRDVLLLTATPVNNSLWDLYHLIQFYMRQDAFLAERGILSIKERFDQAAKEDPSALSPDLLYPIIDATTVKRTRQFVKKHYSGDHIKLADGTEVTIVFPEPRAITVRYELTDPLPEIFDLLEESLDPDQGNGSITFARYVPDAYLRDGMEEDIFGDEDARAAATVGRIVAVAGSVDVEPLPIGRQAAVAGFAPISTESAGAEDRFDILLTTDVLAEGVNLQQCRHIVNFDVPWNPMRLVQRHGRVDRIGSPHQRVFLRTIFPADRLDQLLNLEQRILQKIAMAAASVGVASPVQGGAAGSQVFTETRAEIERLLQEDASLFERGAAGGAGQTGEEYRQTLRKALDQNAHRIERMPFGAGSGMRRGARQGTFFCAVIGDRTYLRFLPTATDWSPSDEPMVSEIGTCLRLIECDEATPRSVSGALDTAIYDLWEVAKQDIHASWMRETDPANLQPRVRPLNQRVAEFIRANRPTDEDGTHVNNALDILEAPWPRREEIMLRDWYSDPDRSGLDKARALVARIRETGLEPFVQPKLLPPIELDDIELVCWMGIETEAPKATPAQGATESTAF